MVNGQNGVKWKSDKGNKIDSQEEDEND